MRTSKDELIVGNRVYVPSKTAAKRSAIGPDYITMLARNGLVAAMRERGMWYVDEISLRTYLTNKETQLTKIRQKLSEVRSRERTKSELQLLADKLNAIPTVRLPHPHFLPLKKPRARKLRVRRVSSLSASFTALALGASIVFGFLNISIPTRGEQFAASAATVSTTTWITHYLDAVSCAFFQHCSEPLPIMRTVTTDNAFVIPATFVHFIIRPAISVTELQVSNTLPSGADVTP